MSRHDDLTCLRQLRDHAREAVACCKGKRLDDLKQDRILQLAMIRLVEVVGEAAGRVSADGQAQYPNLPWQGMVGMRNRLIHGYDAVNVETPWNTIQIDLPALIEDLNPVLSPDG